MLKIGSTLTTSSLEQEALNKKLEEQRKRMREHCQKSSSSQSSRGVCACARGLRCDVDTKCKIECARLEYIEKRARFVIIRGSSSRTTRQPMIAESRLDCGGRRYEDQRS